MKQMRYLPQGLNLRNIKKAVIKLIQFNTILKIKSNAKIRIEENMYILNKNWINVTYFSFYLKLLY